MRRIADRGRSHICPLAFRKYCCSRPNIHTKVAEASEASEATCSTTCRACACMNIDMRMIAFKTPHVKPYITTHIWLASVCSIFSDIPSVLYDIFPSINSASRYRGRQTLFLGTHLAGGLQTAQTAVCIAVGTLSQGSHTVGAASSPGWAFQQPSGPCMGQ